MTLSDSMFLFEVVVEDLESFTLCKEFSIKSELVNVFKLNLRDPNDPGRAIERKFSGTKRKSKMRHSSVTKHNSSIKHNSSKPKLQTGQSILLASNVKWLTSHMSLNPLKLSLWSKKYPKKKLGETRIPWSMSYFSYLNKLQSKQQLQPLKVKGTYNIMNSNKCVAIITLSIKLTHLKGSNVRNDLIENSLNNKAADNIEEINTNTIKNSKECKYANNLAKKVKIPLDIFESGLEAGFVTNENFGVQNAIEKSCLIHNIKSDTSIQMNKSATNNIFQSKSLSSIRYNEKLSTLPYIFGSSQGYFGNQVYCVNYFTVENNVSGKPNSTDAPSKESEQPRGKYHLKLCDQKCPKKQESGSCSQSVCSLDLPEDAGHLVNITKCKQIKCDGRKHREPTPASDDRILLDLANIRSECCNFTEKIEEVVGGVTGKIKIGDDPCYCACECRFGFTKRTTYCNVCGGYEIVGEEFIPEAGNQQPFPCPIFHKLVDKNKLKTWSTSGSESKKKGDDQSVKSMKVSSGQKAATTTKRVTPTKSVESEKDSKKGTKKKKDDRFKFNYGYKAPQIGHSECAMPCTGTLGSVPKNMGWLWTAEEIPGMKVKHGWKPGAISKRLLKALNKAKLRRSVVDHIQPRRVKKRTEQKPALVVCKKDGEYRIEMNPARNKDGVDHTPLVYRIENTDNEAKIKKRDRKQRRLIRQVIKETLSDPYCPENCESICLPLYERAIGTNECHEKKYESVESLSCSCFEEEASSTCSSSTVDWELHFSPPVFLQKEVVLDNIYQ